MDGRILRGLHIGVADHLGRAIVLTARDHEVVDRRRVELIEPGLPAAPVHHVGGPHAFHRKGEPLDDVALAGLVSDVRESVVRATSAAPDDLAEALPGPVGSMSLRGWPDDFPEDIAVQRRVPYESRADPVMYRKALTDEARARRWAVHFYDAKGVEDEAVHILGDRADEVLLSPRLTLGPPWSKDHPTALAAAIVAP